MNLQEHLPLWDKIQNFPIDDEKAALTFSDKLATTQNWTVPFTKRAIEEYRKFILLCCVSEKGAAPSQTIDEVWHLHLTYTQSYWKDLCRDTLGKEIHHYPSSGGKQEDSRHREWYRETLQTYRSVFGVDAPSDIWPAPLQEFVALSDPPFPWSGKMCAAIALLLCLPFFFSALAWHTAFPFFLAGPDFLLFFPLYSLAILFSYILYRYHADKQIESLIAARFPDNASAFQVADFLYGKHRAMQAGIVDLLKKDLLEVGSDHRFLIKNKHYIPTAGEANPLIPGLIAEPDGSTYSYETLMANWYDRTKFAHPGLTVMAQFARHRAPFFQSYLFLIAFYAMALARMIQGVSNDRPVAILVFETIILSVLFMLAMRQFSKRSFVYRKVADLYKKHLQGQDDRTVPLFALEGLPAIGGFAEGILLGSVFAAYSPVNLQGNLNSWNNGDSGSSCSSGGSCSGGSSRGSSGCGGCGGGH